MRDNGLVDTARRIDVGNKTGTPITGGATWTSYTLDSATAELYVRGGNPAPDFATGPREGSNLYSGSVLEGGLQSSLQFRGTREEKIGRSPSTRKGRGTSSNYRPVRRSGRPTNHVVRWHPRAAEISPDFTALKPGPSVGPRGFLVSDPENIGGK